MGAWIVWADGKIVGSVNAENEEVAARIASAKFAFLRARRIVVEPVTMRKLYQE